MGRNLKKLAFNNMTTNINENNSVFNWINNRLSEEKIEELNTLFDSENNYKLIYSTLDEKKYSNNSEFILSAVYLIKKLQNLLGYERYTIVFETTFTKLFNNYIKLVKKSNSRDPDNCRILIEDYCNIINHLRSYIIPSTRFGYFFSTWTFKNKLKDLTDKEKNSQEFLDSFKKELINYREKINNFLGSQDDIIDIDYNYILYQISSYYEISRYSCYLILGLLDIWNKFPFNRNLYYSNKSNTSKVIKDVKNQYQSKIPKSFSAFFQYLQLISREIRNYAAHRSLDPHSEQFESIDDRILDNGKKYDSNVLLYFCSVLYTILKLFECWNYIYLIEIKNKSKEDKTKDIINLRESLYKLYSFFRPTIYTDSQYLIAEGNEIERILFQKKFDSYFSWR